MICSSTSATASYPSWTLYVQVMPYDEAASYRFNPFDLTKVWPHGDYPLIEVGRMTLDRNPTDNHAEIEQAAFQPNNLVPGIGPSPDRMLLARLFSYADAHRHRIGGNYQQLPVNAPVVDVHTYSKDGAMAYRKTADPVYAPNSKGGPAADTAATPRPAGKPTATITRAAYVSHRRGRRLGPARHHGARGPGRRRARPSGRQRRRPSPQRCHRNPSSSGPSSTGRNIDKTIGDRIAQGVRAKAGEKDPKAAEQGNPARRDMQGKA